MTSQLKSMVQLLILFTTAILINNNAFGQDWELAKNKKGISVYTRQSEGSNVKEFKAETVIKSDAEKVLEYIINVESYPQWYSDSKSTELLKKIDANNLVFQMEMKVPFPFANRDMVSKMNIVRDGSSIQVKIINVPDYIGEKKGIVRMPIAEGSWKLTPMANDNLRIDYSFSGDPSGNIPTWIVNMFIVDGPINTLTDLKEMLLN
jgi:ribosome-associated toxin RatA of RatAB toxin-antitoxin module